jgi:hypothetical protein
MKHRSATAAAAIGAATLALLCAPACAHAEPPQPVTPQRDAPCTETLVGAMTRLADGKTNLVCTDQGGGYRWSVFTSPYPSSDRWLTYGPELTLHGQGMRNPEIMSGRWMGAPQESDGVCRAEQVTVLGAGVVSPPEEVTGEPGKSLEFSVSPTLFTIKLSGNCVWHRA